VSIILVMEHVAEPSLINKLSARLAAVKVLDFVLGFAAGRGAADQRAPRF